MLGNALHIGPWHGRCTTSRGFASGPPNANARTRPPLCRRGPMKMSTLPTDLICFSHLRWGFVFQRPNHLMVRFARHQRTFFVEEPRFDPELNEPHMDVVREPGGPLVCVPWLPEGTPAAAIEAIQRK